MGREGGHAEGNGGRGGGNPLVVIMRANRTFPVMPCATFAGEDRRVKGWLVQN